MVIKNHTILLLALQEKAWYDFCFLLKSSIATAQLPEQGGKPKHNALGF